MDAADESLLMPGRAGRDCGGALDHHPKEARARASRGIVKKMQL